MDKKGYMRTIEAIIALVIILSVVFVALPRKQIDFSMVPTIVKSSQDAIKNKIMLSDDIKSCIVDTNCDEEYEKTGDVIEKNKPYGFDYAFAICNNPALRLCDDNCKKPAGKGPEDIGSNVYMADVFISTQIDYDGSTHKVVRFWMWKRVEEDS